MSVLADQQRLIPGILLAGIFADLLSVILKPGVQRPFALRLFVFCTTRAAPIMLSLRNAPDDEALLTAKLDHFARWHMVRATLQVVAFFVLLWALVVISC